MDDLSKVYKKTDLMVGRKIDNEVVLVPIRKRSVDIQKIYNLENQTAVRSWELIDGNRDVKTILQVLGSEFEADPAILERETLDFIKQLTSIEAIRPTG
ncbi:MAG: PqqD family protein [Candidatus Omnitrophica bacterium]|nr:PqqD family protein [Candidatus Omnitrophota bacterium]